MKRPLEKPIVLLCILALGIAAVVAALVSEKSQQSPSPSSYISCGCGCCVFDKPLEEMAKERCLYQSKGDDIRDIMERDEKLTPESCAAAGCSSPVRYVYCD